MSKMPTRWILLTGAAIALTLLVGCEKMSPTETPTLLVETPATKMPASQTVTPASMASAGDDTVDGFQLCYGKTAGEHALTWHSPGSYEHHSIDDGEAGMVGPKMTPVLVADGIFDARGVGEVFAARSSNLPGDIVALVAGALERYESPD